MNPAQKDNRPILIRSPATVRQRVKVPLEKGAGTFVTFNGLLDKGEHIAIVFAGEVPRTTPLVRIHSECLTGDVFSSGKCDCGEQLQESLARIREEGGVLIYLRQEGRGIGLYNKLDAYVLQQEGYDTYESNNLLGFRDDLRSYEVAVQMLLALGLHSLRLLSNNPDKAEQLTKSGINIVERVSTGVFVKTANRDYLRVKATKTAHSLDLAKLAA